MTTTLAMMMMVAVALIEIRANVMPDPFERPLRIGENGTVVVVAKKLLCRSPFVEENDPECVSTTNIFDEKMQGWVRAFQAGNSITPVTLGILGTETARSLLNLYSSDGYRDNGTSAAELGYKFKILIPVKHNRSIETTASFLDEKNKLLFEFPVRTKGHAVDSEGRAIPSTWPSYNSSGIGLNQFSHSGATPTGLIEVDINSPESNETLYGPYPITRFVRGLDGNAEFLVPDQRNGVLIHTGEWPGWREGDAMPNSAGCVHTWPRFVKEIWQSAVDLGAPVRPNTNGALPYPYRGSGLVSVFEA